MLIFQGLGLKLCIGYPMHNFHPLACRVQGPPFGPRRGRARARTHLGGLVGGEACLWADTTRVRIRTWRQLVVISSGYGRGPTRPPAAEGLAQGPLAARANAPVLAGVGRAAPCPKPLAWACALFRAQSSSDCGEVAGVAGAD